MKNISYITKFIPLNKIDPLKTTECPTDDDILQSVIKCGEEITASDEDDIDEEIERPSKEEMLKFFDTIRRGFHFHENVTDISSGY